MYLNVAKHWEVPGDDTGLRGSVVLAALLPVCATQLNLMSCRIGGSWGLPPPVGMGGTDTHPSEPPSWKMGLERVVEK